MHQIASCPLCGKNEFSPFISCKDYTISRETFNIVQCKSCQFKFTNPIPTPEKLGDYYKSESYISHSDTKKGLIAKLYHLVRTYTLKQKLKYVSKCVSRGTILDYGCGTGMFLEVCKQSGWNTIGVEPSKETGKILQKKNLKVYNSINELKGKNQIQKFDAITLWHVLEHVVDLKDTLSYFKEALTENGVLLIAVPNHKSYDAEYYREFWAAFDIPRHLYHFEQETVKFLLGQFNFKLIDVIPMKFDSYYVSMLSEKYRHGKNNLIGAIYRGLISNLKARSKKEYSSLIYVFKKN